MSKNFKFIVGAVVALVLAVSVSTSTSAAYMHSGLLKMGMTSSQVMSLQQTLNGGGFLVSTTGAGSPGMESMYFGAKTKEAVMAFQSAKGLGADGVVGVNTGTALAAMTGGSVSYPAGCMSTSGYSTTTGMPCTSAASATLPTGCMSTAGFSPVTGQSCSGGSTPTTPTGSLSGTVGSIDYDLVSGISNEEVGEDQNDVKVAGLELDAEDSDSDVGITAIKINFNRGTAAAATDFDDVADEVSVWIGSTKVGSVDASEFNDDNDEEKTISLSNAVVRKDTKENLYVAVSGVSNLDTGDIGDTWTVDFTQVRFVDAQGATTTEDPTQSAETFTFESFATANDVELKVTLNDDESAVNDAHVINVDATDDTDNVAILAFTLEADGDSDVNLQEIPVLLTVTGATNVDDMITSVDLYHGTTKVDSQNIPTTAGAIEPVTFDDLDIDINAGDTEEFWVKANFISLADALDAGDTIKAELTATEVDAIDAEDESGENLSATDLTGTAVGEAHAAYDTGIMVSFKSATANRTFTADDAGEFDQAEYKVTFEVTAFDDDARLDRSCEEGGADAAGQGVEFTITNSGSNSTTCNLSSTSTDTEDTVNTYELDEDVARTFSLVVTATSSADAYAEVSLESLNWGTATDNTNADYYTFNLDEFKTSSVFLNTF